MRMVLFVISSVVISRLLGKKIIKILKKEIQNNGKSTHLTRSTSLIDTNDMYCGNLHYIAIQNGLNSQFLFYQDFYI